MDKGGDREIVPKNPKNKIPGVRLIAHRDPRAGHTLVMEGYRGMERYNVNIMKLIPDEQIVVMTIAPKPSNKDMMTTRGVLTPKGVKDTKTRVYSKTSTIIAQEVQLKVMSEAFEVPMTKEIIPYEEIQGEVKNGCLHLRLPRKLKIPEVK